MVPSKGSVARRKFETPSEGRASERVVSATIEVTKVVFEKYMFSSR